MAKLKILTYGNLSREFADYLTRSHPEIDCTWTDSRTECSALLPQHEAVAGFNFLKGEEISHLKWIHSFGAGVESFMQLPLPRGIIVSRTSGRLGEKMAEYCLAYILHYLKRVEETRFNQKNNKWKRLNLGNLYQQDILILGTGTIGGAIARYLEPLSGSVSGVNSTGHPAPHFKETFAWGNLPHSLPYTIVINALPLTNDTPQIVDSDFFSRLDNALYINVGRGGTHNEAALISALDKHISKAVVDVFTQEPLNSESEFWQKNDLYITPHQSGISSAQDVIESFEQAYSHYLLGTRNELFVDLEKGY